MPTNPQHPARPLIAAALLAGAVTTATATPAMAATPTPAPVLAAATPEPALIHPVPPGGSGGGGVIGEVAGLIDQVLSLFLGSNGGGTGNGSVGGPGGTGSGG